MCFAPYRYICVSRAGAEKQGGAVREQQQQNTLIPLMGGNAPVVVSSSRPWSRRRRSNSSRPRPWSRSRRSNSSRPRPWSRCRRPSIFAFITVSYLLRKHSHGRMMHEATSRPAPKRAALAFVFFARSRRPFSIHRVAGERD